MVLLIQELYHPTPSYPRWVHSGFLHVGIVPDDAAAGWWVFSGISHFPHPSILALFHIHLTLPSALKTTIVSKNYTWTKRETTPEGAPLMELIEFGINRVKYACDAVVAVLQEIKRHSTEGRCKTLVVIDGFNGFFNADIRMVTEDKVKVKPSMGRGDCSHVAQEGGKLPWIHVSRSQSSPHVGSSRQTKELLNSHVGHHSEDTCFPKNAWHTVSAHAW
ncbi:hypothetical protein PR048_026100 [Dryococelus australis]|uniref:Small ribosomal subunit protein mS29 n=1 Tax=Dryococelus australis TaxID=614101 RepID=A0ABQ9GKE8_9NEOP|nr:hypothetical protein PR048_026100 [Dryococelus australis]